MSNEAMPINCASCSDEEVGRQMSNFAHTPFVFRGREYASVEGFYQGIKFPEEEKRIKIAAMHGVYARSAGKKAKTKQTTFDGQTFMMGSPEHHAVMKEAIRCKMEQHPEITKAFVATRPRPIIHDTGRPARKSAFPVEVFCQIIGEMREEFAIQMANSGNASE
ncbi:MAG: hypothetical protein QG574_1938 [Cyanobacteriota bacterium erpe_2018_sw_21hr_WHONDRS-SW48-000092_B_bin.40]|nr:hypothetical protein [Cyanobacteriota bacterium erpe_2018_sw_21hr_WHONDRS-SW48-000092_B_bin.40]